MRRIFRRWWVGFAASAIAVSGVASAVTGPSGTVGPRPDGTALTTYGWRVTPAGTQVPLGEKPFGAALSPDGRYLAVSNDGMKIESLSLLNAATNATLQRIDYSSPEALFIGLAWSPDGSKLYASAGGNDKIRVYTRTGDSLTEQAPILLPKGSFPAGITLSADGRRLYSADDGSGGVSQIDTDTGTVLGTAATGRNPFTVELSADGSTAYVTNWGVNTVSVLDASTLAARATMTVGTHPSAMARNPITNELYVSVTDADQIGVIEPGTTEVSRYIDLAPYSEAPVGTSPQGLDVSPDGQTLYVANAGNNDVAVIDLADDRVRGLIPTAWYPTTVTLSRDGSTLLVTNAKGLGAGPNPGGPQVTVDDYSQYSGSMIMGTLSAVPVPDSASLAHYTEEVLRNDRFETPAAAPVGSGAALIPSRPGDPSPIEHVIYIVKENRTYDQMFGSLGKGNGDPSLDLFGDDAAPNQRTLARNFVTLDNFYADGAVSSDGWDWVTAAASNSYNEHLWPVAYSGRGRPDDVQTNRATDPGKVTGDSRLWDRLDDAGISFRNYGMWSYAGLPTKPIVTEPKLAGHTAPEFPAQNLDIKDNSRVDAWKNEFDQYVTGGNLPSMEFIRIGDDHTWGTTPGKPTPSAMVADNDLAVGRIVDAVSHSPYWKNTAIFITEDDAQDGPDHVDAHRTLALVVSPYTQTGRVDSTQYSTVAMMRTMELFAGIAPLTQYDAMATPMTASFTDRPNLTPFEAITPAQSLTETNSTSAPMAAQSQKMDFSDVDRAPEQELNRAIWQSVKGPNSTMPPPINPGTDN